MTADCHHVRYAPTAIGALMDPDFLRRATRDSCAAMLPGVEQPARPSFLEQWRAEAASLSAYLRTFSARPDS